MSRDAVETRIKNLPPLPVVAHKLVTMMQEADCSADDVTKVLSSDQALAGKVLKLANSSFYGLSGKVGSVSRAVVILGFSAIRSMALGLGMAQVIKRASEGMDLSYFWSHALFTGAAARTLAVDSGTVDPEEVFVAGLVHDLGSLVLEMEAPGLGEKLRDVAADQLLEAEKDSIGMPHTRAGQKMMRHWHFPEPLVQMARFHHHPTFYRDQAENLTGFVQLGELLAHALGHSREPRANGPDPVDLARHLGVSLRDTEDLLARTHQEVDRTRAFLEVVGVEAAFAAPPASEPEAASLGTAVILSTEAERVAWMRGLLGIQAWHSVAMRPYLAGDAGEVDLAIVDPRSISANQATKLRKLLGERSVRVASFGPGGDLASVWPDIPQLGVAFSRRELLAVGGREPV